MHGVDQLVNRVVDEPAVDSKGLSFVLVGFALVGWFLIRRMRWGRQFWRLSGMYFIPLQRTWLSWRPILTVALLLLLTVVNVRLDVSCPTRATTC